MKRLLFLIIFSAITFSPLFCAKIQPQKTVPAFEPFTGKIIGNRVRLRLAPSLEGHIVKELDRGDILAVVDQNQEYFAIAPTKDLKAYIFRTHVLDNKVEGERVNIRLEPNLDSPILAQLNSGDHVNINAASQTKGKWLEIDLPKNVHLWVAKDYIENIGPVGYAEKYQQRVAEANQLLGTANLISQAEFRKSFQEIDLERVTRNFERVLTNYTDLEEVHEKAKTAIQALQKDYCDKKIAYLETKAGKAAIEVQSLNAKLTTLKPNEQESANTPQTFESPFKNVLPKENITDKMKVWQPLEYSLFQSWANQKDQKEAKLQDFYQEEILDAKSLKGILEPFDNFVKNKPGDFLVRLDNDSTAYLYSTHVNLQEFVGKRINMKVAKRDSHHFAFPAYYVLEAHE